MGSKIMTLAQVFNHETPRISDLRGFITSVAISIFKEEQSPFCDRDVLRSLLQAYLTTLKNHRDRKGEPEIDTVSGSEAEAVWNEASLQGYRDHLPDTDELSEAVPSWPEAFPMDLGYPKRLLTDLALLAGSMMGARTEAYYRHVRQTETG
jgi:hypothetical protein